MSMVNPKYETKKPGKVLSRGQGNHNLCPNWSNGKLDHFCLNNMNISLSSDLHRNWYLTKMDERSFAGTLSGPLLL